MTREKKEILKQLDKFEMAMSAEEEMGCGFTPSSYFEAMEKRYRYPLWERLSKLQHYNSVEEMLYDTRSQDAMFKR